MVQEWIIYAFVGFIGYFFVNFLFKFVSAENPMLISMILYGAAAIAMAIALFATKASFVAAPKSFVIAAVIGICSVVATIFAIKSINIAPNPGYSTAIYSANFILLTLISVLTFKSTLTLQKFLGVVAVFIGLLLLSI